MLDLSMVWYHVWQIQANEKNEDFKIQKISSESIILSIASSAG